MRGLQNKQKTNLAPVFQYQYKENKAVTRLG